jgi:hypothetical protein
MKTKKMAKPRNLVVLGMLLCKKNQPMRAKQARRSKERKDWMREEG